jgi:hypothetical protein
MTSSALTDTRYSRRIKYLGIGILVFLALYTGLWFWGASYLKREIAKGLAQANASGTQAECANLDIKGFPFRAGVFCDKVTFADPSQKISASFGAFRSAAQVYDPARGIIELDGPLQMHLPSGETVKGNWSLLHASARYGNPLPKQIDIESKEFNLVIPQLAAGTLIESANAQAHLRTVGADVDLASSAAGLSLNPLLTNGRTVPLFDIETNVRVNNGAKFLDTSASTLGEFLRGQSATINTISLSFTDGGGFSVSGPLSVDEAGLLTGDLSVSFSEAEKLGKTIQAIAPEIAGYVSPSLSLAASTAKPGENPKIDVTIRKGKAAIGIFPLGDIPPLK